ncbi:MAG TPA: hypothetical protein VI728_05330, partial [Syntrophales bacterium]|nr:hypothetical protein [Syntrophales bacterium]
VGVGVVVVAVAAGVVVVAGVVGVVGVAAGPQAASTRDSAIKPLTTSQSIFFICFTSSYLKNIVPEVINPALVWKDGYGKNRKRFALLFPHVF